MDLGTFLVGQKRRGEAWMGNNAARALVDSQFSSDSRLRRGEHASNRLLLGAEIGHLPNEIEDFARRVIIVDVYR